MGGRPGHPGRPPPSRGRPDRGHRPASAPDEDPRGGRLSPTRHLALVGCTASGKSELALELARALGDVEIVTVDSMQVYRGMDIGTAKPTPAERAEVPHHLIDMADPGEDWTVTNWAAAAQAAVAGIAARGRRALLVGGTGLYFNALVDGHRTPGRYPEVRQRLESDPDTAALYHLLADLDPAAASRIEANNRRRVIRALEVTIGSERPFSSYGPGLGAYPAVSWRIAGLWLPRPVVTARIRRRVESMVEAGLVAEVGHLASSPISRSARQALGYKEMLEHLEGRLSLDEAIDLTDRRTRSFARRQRVWWRRDPRIRWYGAVENPLAVSPRILGDWRRR